MSGIVVGLDGSGHSQRALERAMKEAAIRHVPLTVLTVHEAIRGYYGHMAMYPDDPERTEEARKAAQAETDKVVSALDSRPTSVTVEAVNGIPAEEILNAGADADMIVLGSRGGGGWARLLLGSVSSSVAEHAKVPVMILPA